jgi:YD repeat-containing protein
MPLQVDTIYNGRNLPTSQTRSHAGLTDLTASFAYDYVGRQTMAKYTHWSGLIYEYDTGYDQAGRVTSVQDDGISTIYAYDAGDQLTGYTRSNSSGSVLGTGAYSYNIGGVDNNGNRAMAGYQTGADNRLLNTTTTHFVYAFGAVIANLDGSNSPVNYFLRGDAVDEVFA